MFVGIDFGVQGPERMSAVLAQQLKPHQDMLAKPNEGHFWQVTGTPPHPRAGSTAAAT